MVDLQDPRFAKMKFSIVVCTKGRYNDLKECLSALKPQLIENCEVVVVDGDGDSAVSTLVEELGFIYVNQRKEGGIMNTPAARNLGIKYCRGDIIAFIDDDAIPVSNWLYSLRSCYLGQNPAAVGGPVIPKGNSNRVSVSKYKNGFIRSTFKALLNEDTSEIGRVFPSGLVTENFDVVPKNALTVENLVGTNMSFQSRWLKVIGSFDESIHTCGVRDETDLFVRMTKKGGQIIYCPEALVYHKLLPKSESNKRLYYTYFTDFYFLFKHRDFFSTRHLLTREALLFTYLILKCKPTKGVNPWKYALKGRLDGYRSISAGFNNMKKKD
jgi:GT2 family glycosyltransferase